MRAATDFCPACKEAGYDPKQVTDETADRHAMLAARAAREKGQDVNAVGQSTLHAHDQI